MAYSYNDFGTKVPGNTITVGFPFIDRSHVSVTVGGVLVAASKWSWLNDGLLSCLAGFPAGAGRVLRTTPDALAGKLVGTAVLDFPLVNTNFDILLYIEQESDDAEAERSARVGSVEARLDAFDGDVATTAANAITTTTQAALSTANAASSLADRNQTAADRVQTGLDKTATAADRVQTGLDRTAVSTDKGTVAADKTTTLGYKNAADADATNTAADRVQTGLDRVATAADRVQTGLDRASATASAAAAAISAGSMTAMEVQIHAAAAKTTLVDADEIGVADSAASWGLKKWTWLNVKAGILAYFNGTNDGTPLDADRVWMGDSTASFVPVYSTWTQVKAFLKTYFDTLYALAAHTHTFASLTSKPTTVAGYGITNVVFTAAFESTQQTLTSAGALTLAHGLGVKPKLYLAVLQCVTADLGYATGDEVPYWLSTNAGAAGQGVSVIPDATNLNIRFGNNSTNLFSFSNKTTGVVAVATNASWKLVMRAWA